MTCLSFSTLPFAATLALIATPVWAVCPTGPDDLTAGIQVEHDDDSVTIYRRLPDGMIEEVVNYQDGSGEETVVVSHKGLWVVSNYLRQDGADMIDTLDKTEIEGGIDALPEPKQDLRWSGNTTFTQAGESPIQQELAVNIGQERNVRYGDCTLTAWPVVIRYMGESIDMTEAVDYLPEFGFGVLAGIKDDIGTDTYVATSIAVVPAAE